MKISIKLTIFILLSTYHISASEPSQSNLFPVSKDNNTKVLQMAHSLLNGSFNAGGGYADVWIRDLNTFIEIALDVNNASDCKKILMGFF